MRQPGFNHEVAPYCKFRFPSGEEIGYLNLSSMDIKQRSQKYYLKCLSCARDTLTKYDIPQPLNAKLSLGGRNKSGPKELDNAAIWPIIHDWPTTRANLWRSPIDQKVCPENVYGKGHSGLRLRRNRFWTNLSSSRYYSHVGNCGAILGRHLPRSHQ